MARGSKRSTTHAPAGLLGPREEPGQKNQPSPPPAAVKPDPPRLLHTASPPRAQPEAAWSPALGLREWRFWCVGTPVFSVPTAICSEDAGPAPSTVLWGECRPRRCRPARSVLLTSSRPVAPAGPSGYPSLGGLPAKYPWVIRLEPRPRQSRVRAWFQASPTAPRRPLSPPVPSATCFGPERKRIFDKLAVLQTFVGSTWILNSLAKTRSHVARPRLLPPAPPPPRTRFLFHQETIRPTILRRSLKGRILAYPLEQIPCPFQIKTRPPTPRPPSAASRPLARTSQCRGDRAVPGKPSLPSPCGPRPWLSKGTVRSREPNRNPGAAPLLPIDTLPPTSERAG